MAQPVEFWLKLYDAFDFSEVLAGERARALYCEREQSPFAEMVQVLRPEERPRRFPITYLTGHRGSGKSSLLFQLRERFKDDYFVIYVNVNHNLDSSRAHLIDLLFLLGTAIFQGAVEEHLTPKPELLAELGESVYTIAHTDRETARKQAADLAEMARGLLVFTASVVGSKIGEKLAEAVLKPFSLSSGVTEEKAKSRTVEPQVQNVLTRINLIIREVEKCAGKPLLVIVDDLDKIQHQEQAEGIFLHSRALTEPFCRVVYTVPMLIYTSIEFGVAEQDARLCFLPNVRLYSRLDDNQRHAGGYDLLYTVVDRRLAVAEVSRNELFGSGSLDRLVLKSGGVMRQFVRLVHEACRFAERERLDQVDLRCADAASAALLRDYGRRVTVEDLEELRKVHETKRPTRECGALIHALLILAYQDDITWFDAHPILWDQLR